MKVRDAMTAHPVTCAPETTLRDAARMMRETDCGALPVVGPDGYPIGVVTDRDITIRAVAEGKSPTTKVGDVMSHEVLYCFDDQELDDIAQNMAEMKVRRLPVVNRDKRLVGIISLGDLARREDSRTAGQTISEISEPGGEHSQAAH